MLHTIDPQVEHTVNIPHLVRDTRTGETIEVQHLDSAIIEMVQGDRFALYSPTTVEQVEGFTPKDLLHNIS